MALALLISILTVGFFLHLRKITNPATMLFANEYSKVTFAKRLSDRCYLTALLSVLPLALLSITQLSITELSLSSIKTNLYSITGLCLAIALWFISSSILKKIGD